MRHYLLYITFVFFAISGCKTNKKQTSNSLVEFIEIDSISEVTLKQQKSKTLKQNLIGKTYRGLSEVNEFDDYSISGGFLIGSTFNNENIVNGKEYSIARIRGANSKTKFLIFEEVQEKNNGKATFKIIDILEIEKETDIFMKLPDKDIDIFSDVLLNGERAPELLALAEYEETDILTKIYKVWRANRKLGKFEEVKNLSGITVSNEDY